MTDVPPSRRDDRGADQPSQLPPDREPLPGSSEAATSSSGADQLDRLFSGPDVPVARDRGAAVEPAHPARAPPRGVVVRAPAARRARAAAAGA
uniref:hypothetical protein n=1 Tax=Rathayibacter sp. VKM Ac-2630 TaxID=1938617 RepID=UPI001F1C363E|nr:hypothetical protein [Rathayibacter sp. VKM Ac-2630]